MLKKENVYIYMYRLKNDLNAIQSKLFTLSFLPGFTVNGLFCADCSKFIHVFLSTIVRCNLNHAILSSTAVYRSYLNSFPCSARETKRIKKSELHINVLYRYCLLPMSRLNKMMKLAAFASIITLLHKYAYTPNICIFRFS